MLLVFFFFKQKTAYEMRISDWSSDVCSSDLWDLLEDYSVDQDFEDMPSEGRGARGDLPGGRGGEHHAHSGWVGAGVERARQGAGSQGVADENEIGSASCRERGCQYV